MCSENPDRAAILTLILIIFLAIADVFVSYRWYAK
jgi:hypothetical protein